MGPNNEADPRRFRELMSLIEQTGPGVTVYKSHTVSHAPRIRSNISAAYFRRKSNPE